MIDRFNLRKRSVVVLSILVGIFAATSVHAGGDGNRSLPRGHSEDGETVRVEGVCPPFFLRDESGNIINPVKELNAESPYSPARTCGNCHDYKKITEGYHFTQGKGEAPTPEMADRCQWVTTPGNYGGNWCSPAPLYRYLSPKINSGPETMDMTSFSFITAGCGNCHPGGGSAEFDRYGKRYDEWMSDPESGLTPGGINGYDGDYYRARWSETGVLEADCLICHMPGYRMADRNGQLKMLNFKWAPTVGAGFGTVKYAVSNGQSPSVSYDRTRFNGDGTISPHIVREPRNNACLNCHAKPGWKKRGANFRARTDVHLRAGLKCIDCHPAGSHADDPGVKGKEVHQIGKGDDPGGHVRDDLDNTCRDCGDCHDNGTLGAPLATHRWLPPLHLEKIACQTCHIPERMIKAPLFQAGDVFNPGARIPTKGKHLWTFYGPDMRYWNHYGDLEMMGYDDKPGNSFQPVLVRYKGKIYPANQVHSAWTAIRVEGSTGLMQPRMGDIYRMWTEHGQDPSSCPSLSEIRDDNGDGVSEINRPDEIDAIIESVGRLLKDIGYPMEGKQVVWVMNDRMHVSGEQYEKLNKQSWEASPYGNVHTYNHDIYPARAALGSSGCTDCHDLDSQVFFGSVVRYPFDGNGNPVTVPQYQVLGLSGAWAKAGALREMVGKPILYGLLAALLLGLIVLVGTRGAARYRSWPVALIPWIVGTGMGVVLAVGAFRPDLSVYMLPDRFQLDGNHFVLGVLILIAGLVVLHYEVSGSNPAGPIRQALAKPTSLILASGLMLGLISGLFMFISPVLAEGLTRLSYTIFDLSLLMILSQTLLIVLKRAAINTMESVK